MWYHGLAMKLIILFLSFFLSWGWNTLLANGGEDALNRLFTQQYNREEKVYLINEAAQWATSSLASYRQVKALLVEKEGNNEDISDLNRAIELALERAMRAIWMDMDSISREAFRPLWNTEAMQPFLLGHPFMA